MLQSLAVPGWPASAPDSGWLVPKLSGGSAARFAWAALCLGARTDFGGRTRAGLRVERQGSAGVVVSGLELTAECGPILHS